MPHSHRITPGETVRLAEIPTDGKSGRLTRKQGEAEFVELREELIEWQRRLYAEGQQRLLIILQAMDAGGKDGTIRHVFQGVNPQGVQVTSFKAPTATELAHDYLWRIHQQVPARGMIRVFNRSQYEDVLVVRVEQLVPEADWSRRYDQINQFEKTLAENGTRILKFYLHLSKEEQRQRFQSRIDDPEKHWKFSSDDLAKRAHWDDYMVAYEEVLNRCHTDWGPWYVIPADRKWYRNLAVLRVLVETFREMAPQYPAAKDDFRGMIVEE